MTIQRPALSRPKASLRLIFFQVSASNIPPSGGYEDALVGIIERFASGKLFPPLRPGIFSGRPPRMPHYRKRLWVSLYRPEAHASISYQAEAIFYEKVLFQRPDEKGNYAFTDTLHERSRRPLYRQT